MATNAMFLLFATTILLVTSRASSHDVHEELKIEVADTKDQVPAPIVKSPAPPPAVVKAPTPPPPLVQPPTPPVAKPPTPPLVKPPTPPVAKPPTPPLVKPPTPPLVKPPTYPPPLPPVKSKEDCIPLCGKRCQLHSRKRVCMRACMTCCDRCRCVPPGTFGNREMCGKCYAEMVTHGNRSKCP